MALYEYVCDREDCKFRDVFEYAMGQAPQQRECPACFRNMKRVFSPVADIWKDHNGNNVRAPGKQWAGGEQFDPVRFKAENPGYKGKLKGEE